MKKRMALLLALLLPAVQAGCIRASIANGGVEVLSGWDDPVLSAVVAGGSVAAEGIERLEIAWVAGSVRVEVGESDQIEIGETAGSGSLDSGMRLRSLFCKPGLRVAGIPEKELAVRVPQAPAQSLRSLRLDTVSTKAAVTGLSGKTLEADAVSGDVEARGGELREIDVDSVSGDLPVLPEELPFHSVRGGRTVVLPAENDGFTLRLDSVSGKLDCALPVQAEAREYIHGDGARRIDCNAVSGDVTIGERP